jgi:pyridoxal phosphate enzyme (YggS family)
MTSISQNLALVQERIAAAAAKSGRRPEDICLVAVTKTVPPERIKEALAAGVQHIGENRVQEAAAKVESIPAGVTWHLIGHLQRNKAKQAIQIFDLIHSLDSLRLAKMLQKRAKELERTANCLVEVNVAGEESKHGIIPDQLLPLLRQVSLLPQLSVRGLMTVAPYVKDPEEVRPIFRQLREMAHEIDKLKLPGVSMEELSMGMSGDFEVAIEEGATMVRVGSAIFGARDYSEN